MSQRMKRSIMSCIAACAAMCFSYAQPKALGGTFSFCGIGISYEHNLSQGCFLQADVRAETTEFFMNRTDRPGISASFTSNFILKEITSRNDNSIVFFAGPGISIGKAHDFHKDNGYFFGLKGRAGVECCFDRNVSISLSLNPLLGSHMVLHEDHAEMKYYKNGLLNVIMPEIGIKHMF